jgi:hypothetical protein
LQRCRRQKYFPLVLHVESDAVGPLCIQLGEIFSNSYDPDNAGSAVPPVSTTESVMVFCRTKTGEQYCDRIVVLLLELLTNPRVRIVTFDCTNDLVNLETIGIHVNVNGFVDCQLSGLPSGVQYLTYTRTTNLLLRIMSMDIDDPLLKAAQTAAAGSKKTPVDANAFVVKTNNQRTTSVVTKRFLEFGADVLTMISLVFAEILREDGLTETTRFTELMLAEYRKAQETFGVKGPYLVRQAAILNGALGTLLDTKHLPRDPIGLLVRWTKLGILSEIEQRTQNALLPLERGKASAVQATVEALLKRNYERKVHSIAKLVSAPQ